MKRDKFTLEQRDAWRAEQKRKPTWRPVYGSRLAPELEDTGLLDENNKPIKKLIGFKKVWSHQPGAILTSAPKGTNQEGACYIVWKDRTLCKIKRSVYELLAKVPPAARVAALKKTLSGVGVAANEGQRDNGLAGGESATITPVNVTAPTAVASPAQNNLPVPVLAEPDKVIIPNRTGEARESNTCAPVESPGAVAGHSYGGQSSL